MCCASNVSFGINLVAAIPPPFALAIDSATARYSDVSFVECTHKRCESDVPH